MKTMLLDTSSPSICRFQGVLATFMLMILVSGMSLLLLRVMISSSRITPPGFFEIFETSTFTSTQLITCSPSLQNTFSQNSAPLANQDLSSTSPGIIGSSSRRSRIPSTNFFAPYSRTIIPMLKAILTPCCLDSTASIVSNFPEEGRSIS